MRETAKITIKSPTYGKFVFLIDAHLEEIIKAHTWHIMPEFSKSRFRVYARNGRRTNGKTLYTTMHRFIMDAPEGKQVDHINGNTLDNRLCNLRLCTNSQNSMNRSRRPKRVGTLKGAHWNRKHKKWKAQIKANNKTITLGNFDSEEEAHKAYWKAAKKLFGEFANKG